MIKGRLRFAYKRDHPKIITSLPEAEEGALKGSRDPTHSSKGTSNSRHRGEFLPVFFRTTHNRSHCSYYSSHHNCETYLNSRQLDSKTWSRSAVIYYSGIAAWLIARPMVLIMDCAHLASAIPVDAKDSAWSGEDDELI